MDPLKWCCRQLAASTAVFAASSPFTTLALGEYQAMLFSCIGSARSGSSIQIHGRRGLGQYSQFVIAGAAIETASHRKAFAEFRKAVGKRHPKLTIETA